MQASPVKSPEGEFHLHETTDRIEIDAKRDGHVWRIDLNPGKSNVGLVIDTNAANIKLPEGVEMVMPGDHVEMEVTLITPIAIEEGLRFAIREGGRTVGSGAVAKIITD